MALLFVYLAKLPYEMIVAGFLLDVFYYFGNGFFVRYPLTIFSFVLIILALFLDKKVHWSQVI
jgi:hypothetical protein